MSSADQPAHEAPPVRWGIMSTADIANKNCRAIHKAPNAELTAVASRDIEKARKFAATNTIPQVLGSYDELLDDAGIDAVYIPLPTGVRAEWVLKALQKGKHVLMEKPCATSVGQLSEIADAAAKHKVQLMDGVMFMHHGRMPAMTERIQDTEAFGRVQSVTSHFSWPWGAGPKTDIRFNPELEPFGALGDLGWYNIRISLWAMGWARPERVMCVYTKRTDAEEGDSVPLAADAVMLFPGGRSATFSCSFDEALVQRVEVFGANQSLRLDDFVIAASDKMAKFMVLERVDQNPDGSLSSIETDYATLDCNQEANMIETFSGLVRGVRDGTAGPDRHWPKISLLTQACLDCLHRSALQDGAWVPLDA